MILLHESPAVTGNSPAILHSLLGLLDSTFMVALSNTQGVLVFVNKPFCERSGYSCADLLGGSTRLLRSGLHSEAFYDGIWTMIRAGRIWNGDVCNKTNNGELYWVSANVAPVFSNDGTITHFLCLMVDITERRIAQEQLVEKTRLATLGQFADGIAHDLNNFLVLGKYAIHEAAELLPRNKELLESALSGMSGLTSRLRSFASGQSCEHHEFSPESMASYITQMVSLKSSYAASIRITMNLDSVKGYLIRGNEGEIASVIINLLINACEALQAHASPHIIVSGKLRLGRIELSVADNGPGIPEHIRPTLFSYKASSKGANRGSGLHSARRVAEAHGGELRLESPGPGAVFVLSLPVL